MPQPKFRRLAFEHGEKYGLIGPTRQTVCAAMFWLGALVVQAADPTLEPRNKMVDEEIVAAGVKNPRVVAAMRTIPRHEFVPAAQRKNAYYDMALPIGHGQTISPPFVVAYMTEQLDPLPGDKVLEIGTGSGYQAAVLSALVKEVYTIEIVAPLGEQAARTLKRLKIANVQTKIGDGYQGWSEHAPFDKIIVTCSPEQVPAALVEQLREEGRMIVPVGERYQQTLYLFRKKKGKLLAEALLPTLFVPMTGRAEEGRQIQPDPARPAIRGGDFEELREANQGDGQGEQPRERLVGWHYQRQVRVVAEDAPEGKKYALFANQEPGRSSHALQGLAIDGRQVAELDISAFVRGADLAPGQNAQQVPAIGILFYDEKRAPAGGAVLGPWRGTFPWRRVEERVVVPRQAREAIVRIGLHGATGEIAFDAVELRAVENSAR